ncbi:MAG: hypothetical protein ABIQ35_08480 [Verrucomicrobiota bacterium]
MTRERNRLEAVGWGPPVGNRILLPIDSHELLHILKDVKIANQPMDRERTLSSCCANRHLTEGMFPQTSLAHRAANSVVARLLTESATQTRPEYFRG